MKKYLKETDKDFKNVVFEVNDRKKATSYCSTCWAKSEDKIKEGVCLFCQQYNVHALLVQDKMPEAAAAFKKVLEMDKNGKKKG